MSYILQTSRFKSFWRDDLQTGKLKEEFLKEIRELEKNLNHQMTKKVKELVEKNDKFIQDFEQLSKNNQSLTNLISKN